MWITAGILKQVDLSILYLIEKHELSNAALVDWQVTLLDLQSYFMRNNKN